MDKIARTVGMDPFEIRLLNAYRNGDMRPYQKVVGDATLVEVIKAAAEMVGHQLRRAVPGDEFLGPRQFAGERPEPLCRHARRAEMAKVTRDRHFLGQLPDRHEPGRRSDPGAHPHDHHRHLRHQPGQLPTWARG